MSLLQQREGHLQQHLAVPVFESLQMQAPHLHAKEPAAD